MRGRDAAENLTATSSDVATQRENSGGRWRTRSRSLRKLHSTPRKIARLALHFWQSTCKGRLPFAFLCTCLTPVRACACAIGTIERRLVPKVAESRRKSPKDAADSRIYSERRRDRNSSEYRIPRVPNSAVIRATRMRV
jgi:hypothetical protein